MNFDPNDPKIAVALTELSRDLPDRVRIRRSNGGDDPFSANAAEDEFDGFTCPAQTGKVKNCQDCGACFSIDKNVNFINHSYCVREDHDCMVNATTIFQKSIKHASEVKKVLQPGNDKLGKRVDVGRKDWLGAKMLCLSLTERATCPKSCRHWRDCYGNNLHLSNRILTDGLMEALEAEISALNPKKKFAIRLHIIGDFWSVEYVEFWRRMLETYPNIMIWGFTAHEIDTNHMSK